MVVIVWVSVIVEVISVRDTTSISSSLCKSGTNSVQREGHKGKTVFFRKDTLLSKLNIMEVPHFDFCHLSNTTFLHQISNIIFVISPHPPHYYVYIYFISRLKHHILPNIVNILCGRDRT